MSELNFNAANVEPDSGIAEPVPAGWYNVMADQSELKPTRDASGARLSVRFTILDGQYANRKIFAGFNIKNSNPVAQEIAYKQLSALAHAVGVLDVKTSEMLHGIALKVKVKVKPAKDEYEASNEITMYKNSKDDTGAVGSTANFASAPAPVAPAGFGASVVPLASLTPVVSAKAGPVMTGLATATYEQYIGAGWTDQQLIASGFMVAPVVAPTPTVAPPGPTPPAWGSTAQPWDNAPVSAPPAPVPAPIAPPAPTAPPAPVNATASAQVAVPPWQQ